MPDLGEFGAELADLAAADGAEPDTFTFHGHEFTLPERVSALPSLRYAYNAQTVDADWQRAQAAMRQARTDGARDAATRQMAEVDLAANAGLYQFLRDMLPGQWERFEVVAAEAGADELELLAVAQKIMAAVAVRPTRRSSGSPAGPSPTGRTSTDASASPVTSAGWGSGSPTLTVTEETPPASTGLSPLQAARAEIHATSVTVDDLVRSGV